MAFDKEMCQANVAYTGKIGIMVLVHLLLHLFVSQSVFCPVHCFE